MSTEAVGWTEGWEVRREVLVVLEGRKGRRRVVERVERRHLRPGQ